MKPFERVQTNDRLLSVEYTVPLIRKMESKILVPLKNSPMQ